MFSAAALGAALLRRCSGVAPSAKTVQVLLVVQMGLEGAVATELVSLGVDGADIRTCWPARGFVAIATPQWLTREMILSLRSVIDALEYHTHFTLGDGSGGDGGAPGAAAVADADGEGEGDDAKIHPAAVDIYDRLAGMLRANPGLVPTLQAERAKTFRVTCRRCGDHKFTSKEVEFEAGGALQEAYGTKAQMRGYDVNVRVDVVGAAVVVGTQLNEAPLSRRHKVEFVNRVTIKANIAFIMLQLGKFKPGDAVLDPFCGSGTILLEAAEVAKGRMTGAGCDCVAATVKGAVANATAEGFGEILDFRTCSVVGVSREFGPETFDLVVTNPPWGVQTGKNADLTSLYRKFLSGSWMVTKVGGYLVCFVLRALLFLEIVRTFGQWELVYCTAVRTRNNIPSIFVLRRLEADEQYNDIRRQLRAIGEYVNVDRALFRKLHDSR